MYPVRLVGTKVVLREFGHGDIDAVAAIVGDDRVTHWLSFDSRSLAQAVAMLDGVIERSRAAPGVLPGHYQTAF